MTEETKMEALDELFKEWLNVRFPEELGFKLSKNLTYDKFNDETKAEFGAWLVARYSGKSQNASEEQAIAILEQFGWCSDRELIPIDPRMRELIDRVRGYIDNGVPPENAVLCMLRDWAKGDTFNSGLDKKLKRLTFKTIMELKLKENQQLANKRRNDNG